MRKAVIALGVLVIGAGCGMELPDLTGLSSRREPQSYAHLLWMPVGATLTRDAITGRPFPSTYKDGSTALGFTLTVGSPHGRVELSDALVAHYRKAGWAEQKTDFLKSGNERTSFTTGWQRGGGGVIPNPPMKPPEVHLWFGEWQDGAGNVVQYRLIASHEADHSSEQVDAYAVYWPTAAAHAARGAE